MKRFGAEVPKGEYNAYLENAARVMPTQRVMAETITTYAPSDTEQDLLDVGCGIGNGTQFSYDTLLYHEKSVRSARGVDARPEAIEQASKEHTDIAFAVDNALTLETIEDNSVSICTSERMIQHLSEEEARRVIESMVRVTRPNGIIAIGGDANWRNIRFSPASPIDTKILDAYQHFIAGFWQEGEVGELMVDAGIQDIRIESHEGSLTSFDQAMQILRLEGIIEKAISEGSITEEEATAWKEQHRNASSFEVTVPYIVTIGTVGT